MQHKELSKKIPKKKGCNEAVTQLRRKMMKYLKQLFRDPSDSGEQRTMDTPLPEIVLENIKAFMKQKYRNKFRSTFTICCKKGD